LECGQKLNTTGEKHVAPGKGKSSHLRSPLLGGADEQEEYSEEAIIKPIKEKAQPPKTGGGRMRSPLLKGTEDFDDDYQEDFPLRDRKDDRSAFPHRNRPRESSPQNPPPPTNTSNSRPHLRSPLLGAGDDEYYENESQVPSSRAKKINGTRPNAKLHSPIFDGAGDSYDDYDDQAPEEIDDPRVLRSPLLAAKSRLPADRPAPTKLPDESFNQNRPVSNQPNQISQPDYYAPPVNTQAQNQPINAAANSAANLSAPLSPIQPGFVPFSVSADQNLNAGAGTFPATNQSSNSLPLNSTIPEPHYFNEQLAPQIQLPTFKAPLQTNPDPLINPISNPSETFSTPNAFRSTLPTNSASSLVQHNSEPESATTYGAPLNVPSSAVNLSTGIGDSTDRENGLKGIDQNLSRQEPKPKVLKPAPEGYNRSAKAANDLGYTENAYSDSANGPTKKITSTFSDRSVRRLHEDDSEQKISNFATASNNSAGAYTVLTICASLATLGKVWYIVSSLKSFEQSLPMMIDQCGQLIVFVGLLIFAGLASRKERK
jgi:hypothetical protein